MAWAACPTPPLENLTELFLRCLFFFFFFINLGAHLLRDRIHFYWIVLEIEWLICFRSLHHARKLGRLRPIPKDSLSL